MPFLFEAVAVEFLEKDRKAVKEGKYKGENIFSGFNHFITGHKSK